jgi:CTP synthase
MALSGFSADGKYLESIELNDHPFMIGVMFNPELFITSEPPASVFSAFIHAAFIKSNP